jgi:hypothetical protein
MEAVPAVGSLLNLDQVADILESINHRKHSFPDESFNTSLAVVLLNFGDRFKRVQCVGGEWTGLKGDLPKAQGVPKCPDGHVCFEGPGLRLGWVNEDHVLMRPGKEKVDE